MNYDAENKKLNNVIKIGETIITIAIEKYF
jgi:hypothetical protein